MGERQRRHHVPRRQHLGEAREHQPRHKGLPLQGRALHGPRQGGLERRPPDQADGGLLLKGGLSQRGRTRNRKGAASPPTPKNIPPFFVRELKPASILPGAPHAPPRLVPPEGEPPPHPRRGARQPLSLPPVKPRSGPALPREAPPPNPRGRAQGGLLSKDRGRLS